MSERARTLGRYTLFDEIASGGMASVHVGRLVEPVGFSRTVAIKRLHAQFAKDEVFASMFLDEARLAARIRHPNVVPTVDVVRAEGELFLVMEYVVGEPLNRLISIARSRKEQVPQRIAVAIMIAVLNGLHAAHETKSDLGEPLDIVHRDISPQNILVGVDGVARLLDFGVARAAGRSQTTKEGQLKGKIAYMSPEQLNGAAVDRRADIFGAGVVLWETLTAERLFLGDSEGATIQRVLSRPIEAPSELGHDVDPRLDAIVLRALERDPKKRYATARDMALVLEATFGPLASSNEIGHWVDTIAKDRLAKRAKLVADIESTPASGTRPIPIATEPVEREPAADVSSISTTREPATRSNRRFTGILLVAGGLMTALVVFLFASKKETTLAPTVTIPPSVTASAEPATVAPAIPEPSATAIVPPSASAPPPVRNRTVPPIATAKSSASAAPKDCDPNYTYVNGIKQYKPWCFEAH